MKRIIKPTLIFVLSNVAAYAVYLLLLVTNVISCYELECVEFVDNLPIYITFFVGSVITTFLFSLCFRLDKTELLILIAEIVLLDAVSLNFTGLKEICYYVAVYLAHLSVISNGLIFIVSYLLSALVLTATIIISQKLVRFMHNNRTNI